MLVPVPVAVAPVAVVLVVLHLPAVAVAAAGAHAALGHAASALLLVRRRPLSAAVEGHQGGQVTAPAGVGGGRVDALGEHGREVHGHQADLGGRRPHRTPVVLVAARALAQPLHHLQHVERGDAPGRRHQCGAAIQAARPNVRSVSVVKLK